MTIAQNELRDAPRVGDAVKRGDCVTSTMVACKSARINTRLTFTNGLLVKAVDVWANSGKKVKRKPGKPMGMRAMHNWARRVNAEGLGDDEEA